MTNEEYHQNYLNFLRTHPPKWIPLEGCEIPGKLFMRSECGKYKDPGIHEIDKDGNKTVKWTWDWKNIKATHYWSF